MTQELFYSRTKVKNKSMTELVTKNDEMPKYVSHKEVHALKISSLELDYVKGTAIITPEDKAYGKFAAPDGWIERYKGGNEQDEDFTDTGYYVVYKDGYTSWSPNVAFEEGYELIK